MHNAKSSLTYEVRQGPVNLGYHFPTCVWSGFDWNNRIVYRYE